MSGPWPEVAEIFRSRRNDYLREHSACAEQRRVLRDICACRTSALGGHVKQCDRCGRREIAYNSCRNRHCNKCQAQNQANWMRARAADLLETPYFHVVFTLPDQLGPVALQNKRILYGILFQAASRTLLTIAADKRHLGARIGFTALLHSWGQTLHFHPHVHCLVPGGGISPDESRWVASRPNFFLPVRVLGRLFRNQFLHLLRQARKQGKLAFHGKLRPLSQTGPWAQLLNRLQEPNWVVYCKPPFARPEQMLKYLARYTHRVAISNSRLVSFQQGKVTFRYKCNTSQTSLPFAAGIV